MWRDDPDYVALRVLRMTVLLRMFGRALITTDQEGGVVRELDVLYRRHEQREAEEAAKAAA
jgi:hypothetical protein